MNMRNYKKYIKKIIKIQSVFRGYIIRKKLRLSNDNFTYNKLNILLNNFIDYTKKINKLNKLLIHKKIRMPNFPSEISENVAKFAIFNKYKIMPSWDNKNGDLIIRNKWINKKFEVKAFSSSGPTSFGPTENWDYIYFVNAKKYKQKYFKIYELKLSNNDKQFYNIKINKNETYYKQCKNKRRPRLCFKEIKIQLKNHIKLIFKGKINKLFH